MMKPCICWLILALLAGQSLLAQSRAATDPIDNNRGRLLYQSNCQHCHAIRAESLGPSLPAADGLAMDKQDPTWILRWIQDSQALVRSHDPHAVAVFERYGRVEMPAFRQLSVADIRDIGAYTVREAHRLDSLRALTPRGPLVEASAAGKIPFNWLAFGLGALGIVMVLTVLVWVELVWVVTGKTRVQQAKANQNQS